MRFRIVQTSLYRKSYRQVSVRKGFSQLKLDIVVNSLAAGNILPATNKDHQLQGNLRRYRECHVQPDVLLMYEIRDDILVLVLVDIGSHNDLFKK
ncbi:MAG: type II toxin-antitoxin system YafQ family toxin [Candidatus Paceibacterota bacterium]|jgi:mRNA interferase YafQ